MTLGDFLVLSPSRMRATVIGDVDKIADPFKVLIERYKPNVIPANPVRMTREFLTNLGVNPTSVGPTSHSKVIALGSTESTYAISAAKGMSAFEVELAAECTVSKPLPRPSRSLPILQQRHCSPPPHQRIPPGHGRTLLEANPWRRISLQFRH